MKAAILKLIGAVDAKVHADLALAHATLQSAMAKLEADAKADEEALIAEINSLKAKLESK